MNKAKLKNLAKIVFGSAFVSLMLAAVPVYAFDGATLSEIKISSKDNYSYKIILKTDKDVPVEKYITSDNKIVIDLKNTKSAEFVNTIYNNTPEIDNVIVQSVANNKIRVFIQGLNIASSKIILDSRSDSLDFMGDNSPAIPATTNNVAAPKPQTDAANTQPPVINLGENTASASNTAVQEPANAQYAENNLQTSNNNLLNEKSTNLETVKNMHPALRSRIRGYGYEVYMNETIPDTQENRNKIAVFVAQEVVKDKKIPHFSREAVDLIIEEARKRANRKGHLTLRLRELGGLIRAAGDVAK